MSKNKKNDTNNPRKLTQTFFKRKVGEIEKEFEYYKSHLEAHPMYNSTWKIFWEKRYSEIEKQGKLDPEKYDYTGEWIIYWKQYLDDYYYNKIKFYRGKTDEKLKKNSPICISSSSSESSLDSKRKKRRNSSSDSFSSDSLPVTRPKELKRSTSFSSVSSAPLSEDEKSRSKKDEPVTLLSVCRMLSVLDSELGNLLSNTIVELFSQTIELEKLHPNSSEEVLMTYENVTFLETVKEKLKGLISTNLLAAKKLPIAKKCVQNIAQLIHQYPVQKVMTTKNEPDISQTSAKLTEIITKALNKFGKDEISPDELDVITEIYLEELENNVKMASKVTSDKFQQSASPLKSKIDSYQTLSDDELKILIKNFTQLTDEEQNGMIKLVTEMEKREPERVKNLQCLIDNNDEDDDDYNFDELISKMK